MPRHHSRTRAWFALALLATGCATRPVAPLSQAAPETLDCAVLAQEIDKARQARRDAQEREQGAWKAVVPFAIAGRYASAHADAGEAERRLARLDTQYAQKGCAADAG